MIDSKIILIKINKQYLRFIKINRKDTFYNNGISYNDKEFNLKQMYVYTYACILCK